jgi:hypothetical protein
VLLWYLDSAARKKGEARMRRFSCAKKLIASFSREGELGPPTFRRTGGLLKGEMSWLLVEGKWWRGVGEEMR